jgi:hypothetical protein
MIRIKTYIDQDKKNYVYTFSFNNNWLTYVYRNKVTTGEHVSKDLMSAGQNHLQAANNLRASLSK